MSGSDVGLIVIASEYFVKLCVEFFVLHEFLKFELPGVVCVTNFFMIWMCSS